MSAKTRPALRELCARHARLLATLPAADAADVCYTAAQCRTHLKHRVAIVGADSAALCFALLAYVAESEPQVAGLFLGPEQGSASRGMPSAAEHPALSAMDSDSAESAHLRLANLAQAYVRGVPLPSWEELYPEADYRKVALPTYPFQRQRHWYGFQPFKVPRYWGREHQQPKRRSSVILDGSEGEA